MLFPVRDQHLQYLNNSPLDHGLLVLDNFMGNRTPLRDLRLRGAVLGLQLGTTPAQLYRATAESVAYGTRQVLESFAAGGIDTAGVVLSGGIRLNLLWLQLTADVLGRPVLSCDGENLTLLACAAIAAAAVSGSTPRDEAGAFAPATRQLEPVGDYALYDEGYAVYLEAVTATAGAGYRLIELSRARARDQGAGAVTVRDEMERRTVGVVQVGAPGSCWRITMIDGAISEPRRLCDDLADQ